MFLEGLDELDQKILERLIKNARMSYSQIGQEIGISRVAVKMRVQALEKRGIIEEYTTIVNPDKISGALSYYFEIETKPNTLEQVIEILKKNETITQIYRTTGSSHLHVHAVASSNEEIPPAAFIFTLEPTCLANNSISPNVAPAFENPVDVLI